MDAPRLTPHGRAKPTVAELYTPKLVSTLREGYGLADLKADAIAGLTVAVVALPLCMAIAIASRLGPERGLYTGIVGSFLISLLGGSRFRSAAQPAPSSCSSPPSSSAKAMMAWCSPRCSPA